MSTRQSPLHYPAVRIPKTVALDGAFLRWEDDSQDTQWRRPTDRTLIEFAKLHGAPLESVCDFARRYGVLRAFKLPPEHAQRTDVWPTLRTFTGWGFSNLSGGGKEPIALWQYLSKRLRAILRINAALKGRSRSPLPAPGLDADWKTLDPGSSAPPLEDARDSQFFLRLAINDWLRSGSVGIELGIADWSRQKTDWKLEIAYNGLLGGLAYRLLLTVVGESNLYACDGCGCPYIRTKRAPRPRQENFCDDCTGIAKRRASQRWKEKNR